MSTLAFQNCGPGFKTPSSQEAMSVAITEEYGEMTLPVADVSPTATPSTTSTTSTSTTTTTTSTTVTTTTMPIPNAFLSLETLLLSDLVKYHRASDLRPMLDPDLLEGQTAFPMDVLLKEKNPGGKEFTISVDRRTMAWSIAKASLLADCTGVSVEVRNSTNSSTTGIHSTVLYSSFTNKNVPLAELSGGLNPSALVGLSNSSFYQPGNLRIKDTGGKICPVSISILGQITAQTKAMDGSSLARHSGRTLFYLVNANDLFDLRIGLFDNSKLKSIFDDPTSGVSRLLRMQKIVNGTWQFVDDSDNFTIRWCQVCSGPGSCPRINLNSPLPEDIIHPGAREIDISCWVFKDGQDRWIGVNENITRKGSAPYHSPNNYEPGSPPVRD
jgi:hypothetical protein